MEKLERQLNDLIHLQGKVLQTPISDAYMHGLVNGLLTAKSLITGKQEPLFKKFGDKYIQVIKEE